MAFSARGWGWGLALVLFAARPALAQPLPSGADRDAARSLMDEGHARRDRHDLRGALESFQGADSIMHVPTTGLEVARAEIDLGMLVEARDKLLEVSRYPQRPREPRPFTQARTAAQSIAEDLESRIPTVQLVFKGVPEGTTPTVAIDGTALPAGGIAGWRKLNPGHHEIVARAGDMEQREDVSLREREKKEVLIDLTAPGSPAAAAAAAAPAPAPTTEGRTSEVDTSHPAGGPWKTVMFVGFGIGVVGIALGSVTGIMSIVDTNDAKSIPASQGGCTGNVCGPAAHDDIQAAKTTGTISTVAFIAGGVGVGVGVLGLVLSRSPKASSSTAASLRVEPWLGAGSAGVRGSF